MNNCLVRTEEELGLVEELEKVAGKYTKTENNNYSEHMAVSGLVKEAANMSLVRSLGHKRLG